MCNYHCKIPLLFLCKYYFKMLCTFISQSMHHMHFKSCIHVSSFIKSKHDINSYIMQRTLLKPFYQIVHVIEHKTYKFHDHLINTRLTLAYSMHTHNQAYTFSLHMHNYSIFIFIPFYIGRNHTRCQLLIEITKYSIIPMHHLVHILQYFHI